MEAIVTAALVGTGRQGDRRAQTGTPVDALVAGVTAEGGQDKERALLLAAGAWAVYRQAGRAPARTGEAPAPARAGEVPAPAGPETLAICPEGAARLLRALFDAHTDLLPEALERLRRAGWRLPPDLLPAALDLRAEEVRRALIAVLGERGGWLARFNPAWAWVADAAVAAAAGLPADAETLWQEGTPRQRLSVLRRLRAADPARAREWVADVWKREKVDFRVELVRALQEGLSPEDEPFLEAALDDRGANVRAAAAPLLATLPGSAYADRARARADALLTGAAGTLTAKPPKAFEKAWERDGIPAKPRSGMGERGWWLMRALALVAPAHWEEHFALPPTDLIAAASAGDRAAELLEGWTRAALLHDDKVWIVALWEAWLRAKKGKGLRESLIGEMRSELLPRLPSDAAERVARRIMAGDSVPDDLEWDEVVSALPTPWPQDFAETYLHGLRTFVATGLTPKTYDTEPWYMSLPGSATALPSACFAAALEPWELSDTAGKIEFFRRDLDQFVEIVRLRQRLMEEIPL